MNKQILGLIIAVAVVLTVLFSFIAYNQWPLMTGKTMVLDTRPVDPFDPFRGQYMTIAYEIGNLEDVEGFKAGDCIYVSLEKDAEGIWRLEDSSKIKPSNTDFIRGKVTRVDSNNVRVEYGIEQFFFERNAEVPTANITVEVKVAGSGRAKLVNLLQEGKPIEIEYEEFSIKS